MTECSSHNYILKKIIAWAMVIMIAVAAPCSAMASESGSGSADELINVLNLDEMETGYVSTAGVIGSTDTLAYTKRIPVSEGDMFKMWYFGSSAVNEVFRFVTAYDAQGMVVPTAGADSQKSYTVPDGVSSLVFTVSKASSSKLMIIRNSVEAPASYIAYNGNVETLEIPKGEHLINLFDLEKVTKGYMAPNGGVTYSDVLCYSEKIAVTEGDVLYVWNGSTSYNPRFITAFDAEGIAVSTNGSSSPSAVYTVPSGISDVVFTVYTSALNKLMIIKNDDTVPPVYIPYGKTDDNDGDDSEDDGNPGAVQYGPEYLTAFGNMGPDTTLNAGKADIITDKHLIFTADVESFEGLRLGHGYKDYTANYIEIDETKIKQYFYTSGASLQKEVTHGLEIKDDIKVTIDVNTRRVASVTLESDGKTFTFSTSTTWYGSNGAIYATSMGSELKNAGLAFTCDGYADDIHFYGDSYLSQSSDRWLYFAFNDGYTDALFDGYGGRGSGGAYASLVENLKHSDPETVVWMMGMNDGSDTNLDTPSASWAVNRDKLIQLSEEEGFEIVFATIPTVPNINHEAKNKWIRESGYRYIDVATGVGADGTGVWTDGMLNADKVHPTAAGSKAIYQQVMKDFPDLSGVTAQVGVIKYKTLEDALENAKAGETVLLLNKTAVKCVSVPSNVTLDLNGNELKADYCACFGNIIDNSEANTGVLKTPDRYILMQKANEDLPVKDGEGYRFYKLRDFKDAYGEEGISSYMFLPYFDLDSHELIVRGADATGVTVNVKAVWGTDNIRTQIFTYSDDAVSRLIAGYDTTKPGTYAKMFTLKLINAEAFEDIQVKAVIMSELGVEIPVK